MAGIFAARRTMKLSLFEIILLVIIVISGIIATAVCVIMAVYVHPLVWIIAPLPLVITVFLVYNIP